MKKTKIVSLATVAALSAVALAPITTFAADTSSLTGQGTIKFKEDNSVNPPQDPENPGTEVTPKDPDGNKQGETQTTEGPLTIDYVSTLQFGEVAMKTTQATYNANPTYIQLPDGTFTQRGNYVQVTDKRAGDDMASGWTLKAAMTKQFTLEGAKDGDVNTTLKGAVLTYTNPYIEAKQNPAGLKAISNFDLTEKGEVVSVMSAAPTKSFGTYTVEFGSTADKTGGEATDGNSVSLMVPANTAIKVGKVYTADITWTLSNEPDATIAGVDNGEKPVNGNNEG